MRLGVRRQRLTAHVRTSTAAAQSTRSTSPIHLTIAEVTGSLQSRHRDHPVVADSHPALWLNDLLRSDPGHSGTAYISNHLTEIIDPLKTFDQSAGTYWFRTRSFIAARS